MEITWIMFKDAFYQQYFPPLVRNAKGWSLCNSVKEIGVYQSISPNSRSYANFFPFNSRTLTNRGSALSLKAD